MNKLLFAILIASSAIASGPAGAEDRRDRGERPDRGGRHESHGQHQGHAVREVYQARHWVYDNRYLHGRYYPTPGYSISILPPGNVGIRFGRGHFFFHAGVWYQPSPAGFVVVRPPIGIAVPMLPFGYSTLWVNNLPYYYANEVYYTGGPGNYVVAPPPTIAGEPTVQPPSAEMPAPAGLPAAPPQAPGSWYYCESAKAYYPYVAECKEGWRPVPATPPGTK